MGGPQEQYVTLRSAAFLCTYTCTDIHKPCRPVERERNDGGWKERTRAFLHKIPVIVRYAKVKKKKNQQGSALKTLFQYTNNESTSVRHMRKSRCISKESKQKTYKICTPPCWSCLFIIIKIYLKKEYIWIKSTVILRLGFIYFFVPFFFKLFLYPLFSLSLLTCFIQTPTYKGNE